MSSRTDHFILQKINKIINIKFANSIIISILSIPKPNIYLPLFHILFTYHYNIYKLVILGIPYFFVEGCISVV